MVLHMTQVLYKMLKRGTPILWLPSFCLFCFLADHCFPVVQILLDIIQMLVQM